jgi:hypothetical protein
MTYELRKRGKIYSQTKSSNMSKKVAACTEKQQALQSATANKK